MIRDSIFRLLAPHQLTSYLQELRQTGRKRLPAGRRKGFAGLFEEIKAISDSSPNLSSNEYATIQFVSDFCEGENFLSKGLPPRYTTYTNLAIVDRFIGVRSRWTLGRTFSRCRVALALLARDWLEYEQSQFLNQETAGDGFDARTVSNRIRSLKGLKEALLTEDVPHVNELTEAIPPTFSLDWEYFACSQGGAAGFLHGTSLPQSRYHDEYLFLRTLHLSEVCFWAIICGLNGAADFLRKGDWQNATACLKEANVFAGHLQPVFKIFKTMAFESFAPGFRDDTGDSSAIQSEKFQLIDLLVRGYNDAKRSELAGVSEHAQVAKRQPLVEDTLPGMFDAARNARDASAKEFMDQCIELDRQMKAWRGEHLGIVKHYLGISAVGTGGKGYDYLHNTFRDPGGLPDATQAPVEPSDFDPTRPAWLMPGGVDSAHRADTNIGLIRAEHVSKKLLIAFVDARSAELLKEIRDRSDEIDARIAAYDIAFARYSYECMLASQKARLLRDGFPAGVAPSFVLALEMTTGVLAGLHEFARLTGTLRIRKALAGERFKPLGGGERLLKPNEICFADAKSVFATYFQGPDQRTVVRDLRAKSEVDDIGDLLCLVMAAPDTPRDVFKAAMTRGEEWLRHVSQRTTQYVVEVEL
jgi:tryptophan 2,3-dioxygenase